ncbi:hypothetical protein [Bacteroides sp. 214]|uniref:hypothetical protein n=1 Tax=Bacteroides sp. 214 TaxID=2302935 RepID=UPI0013D4E8E9|nr:hypothetical protein [Bacteroides sp. 214]
MNTKPIYALLLCILASCQSSRTTDIKNIDQELVLWNGLVDSRFTKMVEWV